MEVAKTAVRNAGKEIAANGVPKSMGPLTFALIGAGKVSKVSELQLYRITVMR